MTLTLRMGYGCTRAVQIFQFSTQIANGSAYEEVYKLSKVIIFVLGPSIGDPKPCLGRMIADRYCMYVFQMSDGPMANGVKVA